MHKRPLSPSTISGTESEADNEPLARMRVYDSNKDAPYQPPHPQHIPSSLEIARASALIADQDVKVAKLNTKLEEMARDTLLLTRQRDAAAQAARNYRSFIAGK